ncbi:hypothetical protein GX51_07456 [Blastomyces parvus]|uniref:Uncharacterized protein n=1 Tax=Blastomyces parvus TaxID=2060905 RepID=A0A2B7WL11_9EURO|nr:hypothetical protein GX51_07456 [Blastomyces parvus]
MAADNKAFIPLPLDRTRTKTNKVMEPVRLTRFRTAARLGPRGIASVGPEEWEKRGLSGLVPHHIYHIVSTGNFPVSSGTGWQQQQQQQQDPAVSIVQSSASKQEATKQKKKKETILKY